MNRKTVPAIIYLVVAIVFVMLGLHSVPRNTTYLVLGIAFAVMALAYFRRFRTPG